MRTLSDNIHSAMLATAASLVFTINDGLMKYILAEFDLFVSLAIRGLFAVPMLVFFYLYEKNLFVRLSRRDSLLLCGRAAGEMGLTYCLLTALIQMPLATITALLQSSPLFLSLVAFIFFGERFGWRRWVTLGVGYLGVLIIIRPSETVPLSAALFGLATVIFIVIRDCLARLLSDEVPTLLPAFVNVIAVMIFAFVMTSAMPHSWSMGSWSHMMIGAYFGAAITIIVANMLIVGMMRKGDIGFVSQFRYSAILFSLIAGYLMFDEWPDMPTFFGAVLIIGAGLYSFYRERKHQSKTAGA